MSDCETGDCEICNEMIRKLDEPEVKEDIK
jgi:uncharacterized protein with PIN domain